MAVDNTSTFTNTWTEGARETTEKVIDNTIEMYGSIRGIGGKAIQPVQALELPAAVGEDVE